MTETEAVRILAGKTAQIGHPGRGVLLRNAVAASDTVAAASAGVMPASHA